MTTKYTPGATVTVGDLEVGDTIYLRERRSSNRIGLPVPVQPVVVTEVVPVVNGQVSVYVRNVGSDEGVVEPRLLGHLPVSREFRAAVAVPEV